MTAVVRPATSGDVPGVRRVARDAWYAAYAGILEPTDIERALETNYEPSLLEAAVEHEDVAFVVAATEDAVLGFASAEVTWSDEVELHTLYVDPDHWREGVGTNLLENVVTWARDRSVERIACGVLIDNAVGVSFLETSGFQPGPTAETEVAGVSLPEREYELAL